MVRLPALRVNLQCFYHNAGLRHYSPTGQGERIFIIAWDTVLGAEIGWKKGERGGFAKHGPAQRERQTLSRIAFLSRKAQQFVHVPEFKWKPSQLTDRSYRTPLHSQRLGKQPQQVHGNVHDQRTWFPQALL